MKEYGTLEKVVAHLRAKSELKAVKSQKKKVIDEDDVESEDEVPPNRTEGGSDRENAEEEDAAAEERRKQKEQKKKVASKRGTGGVHVPEIWMWEARKETAKSMPRAEVEAPMKHVPRDSERYPHRLSFDTSTRDTSGRLSPPMSRTKRRH